MKKLFIIMIVASIISIVMFIVGSVTQQTWCTYVLLGSVTVVFFATLFIAYQLRKRN